MRLLRANWRLIAIYAALGACVEPVLAMIGFAFFSHPLHWPTIAVFMLLGAITGGARRWWIIRWRELRDMLTPASPA